MIVSPDTLADPKNCSAATWIDRAFSYLLLAATLLALIPRIVLGVSQFISYDGFWHLFIATQNDWRIFYSDWNSAIHPPLYFLVLRFVAQFGHAHLLYRLPSIITGVAAVYVTGRIAGKLYCNKWFALLAACAFAFSILYIDLTIDLRSYPLALFFSLMAFDKLLDFYITGQSLLAFGILTALAIATEYFAILFFLACIAATAVNAIRSRAFRRMLSSWVKQRPMKAVLALAIPAAVVALLFALQINVNPIAQNNVMDFYWDHHTPASAFLFTQLHRDLNFFLPIELTGNTAFFVVLWTGLGAVVGFITLTSDGIRRIAASTPALMVLLLILELMVFSLLRLYPFGGYFRQQSIVFPFLILTAFALLDSLVARIPRGAVNTLVILGALTILVSALHGWKQYPRSSVELRTQEYDLFRQTFPDPPAVYLDAFTVFAYYIHTYAQDWRFGNVYRVPDRIETYKLRGTDKQTTVMRNLDAWNFDLQQPHLYQALATAMRAARVPSIDLFYLKQFPQQVPTATLEHDKESIRSLAATAGLAADIRCYNAAEACVNFRLN